MTRLKLKPVLTLWIALLFALWAARVVGGMFRSDVLAFASLRDGDSDIFLLDVNRNIIMNLTKDEHESIHPMWSPDGTQLAYQSDENRAWDIYRYNLRTGETRNITRSPASDLNPVWLSDGRLVFRYGGGSAGRLRMVRDEVVERFSMPSLVEAFFDISDMVLTPNNLYFISQASGNYDIYQFDTVTGETINFSQHEMSDFSPSLAPDGRMVFTSWRSGNPDLWLWDGRLLHNLTHSPAAEDNAVWSPNGTHIAFEATRDRNVEIYLMDVASREMRNLTVHHANDFAPAWMP